MITLRIAGVCSAICLMVALAGCGGGGGPKGLDLTGKVTVGGVPVNGTKVLLNAPDGAITFGITDATGAFTIAQVKTEGEMQVSFEPPADMSSNMAAIMKKNADPNAKIPDVAKGISNNPKIPAKYLSPKTSGKTWNVNKDNKVQNFDL